VTLQWHEAAVGKAEVPSGPSSSLFLVQTHDRFVTFPPMGSGNLEIPRRRSSVKLAIAEAASAPAVWESHRLNEWLHALFDVF